MKKIAVILVTITMIASVVLMGGCVSVAGKDGVDGKDGQNVSIYEIYDATNEARVQSGLSELTFLQFVEEYLSYNSDQLNSLTAQEAVMNYSLLAGVSILTIFDYTETTSSSIGRPSTVTYNQIYAASGVIIDIDKENGDALIVTNAHEVYDSGAVDVFTDEIYMFLYGQDTNNVNYILNSTRVASTGSAFNPTYLYSYTMQTTVNGTEYGMKGEIIGVSLDYDLAVIKVENSDVIKNSNAVAAKFSSDDVVTVGESVYLIGQPGGYGLSCTSGIISKDSEYITLSLTDSSADAQQYRVIRTDAAINGGNSGGALYNTSGQIIGIVNAKSSSSSSDNLGYALAGSMVKRVVQSMIDNYSGSYSQGVYLASAGVTTATCKTGAEYDESTGKTVISESLIVTGTSNTGLFGGELEINDYILSVTVKNSNGEVRDSVDITRGYLFTDILFSVRVGDTVELEISRSGEKQIVSRVCSSTHMLWTD